MTSPLGAWSRAERAAQQKLRRQTLVPIGHRGRLSERRMSPSLARNRRYNEPFSDCEHPKLFPVILLGTCDSVLRFLWSCLQSILVQLGKRLNLQRR